MYIKIGTRQDRPDYKEVLGKIQALVQARPQDTPPSIFVGLSPVDKDVEGEHEFLIRRNKEITSGDPKLLTSHFPPKKVDNNGAA